MPAWIEQGSKTYSMSPGFIISCRAQAWLRFLGCTCHGENDDPRQIELLHYRLGQRRLAGA